MKDVDFVKYLLLSPIASGTDNLVALDNTSPSGWNGIMPLTLDHVSPVTLTFQIDTSNNSLGTIRLADLPLPIDDWWKGVPTLRRLGNEQGILMGAGFAWWSMSADPNYRRTIENVYSTLVLSDSQPGASVTKIRG